MEQSQHEKRVLEPRLTIRLSHKTHKALKRIAVERDTSVQALVAPALEALANQQP